DRLDIVLEGADRQMYVFVLDHVGKAVGAKQEVVAALDLDLLNLDVDRRFDAERASNVVTVRGALGFLRRVKAAIDQLLKQRVVQRDLLESVAPQAVEARVADVRDGRAIVVEEARDERRAHALALRLRLS